MKGYSIIVGQYLDQLKSDDSKKRLSAVEHLLDIAKALGPERSKTELLPFLKELLEDEEEVLVTLAHAVYDITKFCLKSNDYAKLVFPIYESMFSAEDSIVRNTALEI